MLNNNVFDLYENNKWFFENYYFIERKYNTDSVKKN